MKTPFLASVTLPVALSAVLLAGGCNSNKPQPQQSSSQPNQQQQFAQQQQQLAQQQQQLQQEQQNLAQQQAAAQKAAASATTARHEERAAATREREATTRESAATHANYTIPAGTHISVTTSQELSSKTSQSGESFTATLASPIVVDGRTLARAGSEARGTVVAAKSQGRIKGAGELDLRLDTVRAEGRTIEVDSSSIEQAVKGKGKRTGLFALGGGGGGALIGALAGGGKGALIGGLLGAGGGTAAGAFTGNKPAVIPAETTLTFRLEHSVTVQR